jgi:catalase
MDYGRSDHGLKQAEELWASKRINVFDLTHIWPHKDYPLRKIEKVTLIRNVKVRKP